MSHNVWRDVPRNIIQSTLLLYYFRSYSPNVLRVILKRWLLLILYVLKKRPAVILQTFGKDIRRVTYLGCPKDPILNFSYKCIFTVLFSILFHQMRSWNTKEIPVFWVLGFWRKFLKKSYKGPKVSSGGWCSRNFPSTTSLNINTKRISAVIISVLVHQMCLLWQISYGKFFQPWRNVI